MPDAECQKKTTRFRVEEQSPSCACLSLRGGRRGSGHRSRRRLLLRRCLRCGLLGGLCPSRRAAAWRAAGPAAARRVREPPADHGRPRPGSLPPAAAGDVNPSARVAWTRRCGSARRRSRRPASPAARCRRSLPRRRAPRAVRPTPTACRRQPVLASAAAAAARRRDRPSRPARRPSAGRRSGSAPAGWRRPSSSSDRRSARRRSRGRPAACRWSSETPSACGRPRSTSTTSHAAAPSSPPALTTMRSGCGTPAFSEVSVVRPG